MASAEEAAPTPSVEPELPAILWFRLRRGADPAGYDMGVEPTQTVSEVLADNAEFVEKCGGIDCVALVANGMVCDKAAQFGSLNLPPNTMLNVWRSRKPASAYDIAWRTKEDARLAALAKREAEEATYRASAARMAPQTVLEFFTFEDIMREWVLPRLKFADQLALAATCKPIRAVVLRNSLQRVGAHLPPSIVWEGVQDQFAFRIPPGESDDSAFRKVRAVRAPSENELRAFDALVTRGNLVWLTLELHPSIITNATLERIAACCPLLEGLRIGNVGWEVADAGLPSVTDAGLRALLSGCPRLKILSLVACPGITARFVRELRAPTPTVLEYCHCAGLAELRSGVLEGSDGPTGAVRINFCEKDVARPIPRMLDNARDDELEVALAKAARVNRGWIVYVKTALNDHYTMRTYAEETIGEFKQRMEIRTGVPADSQRFIFAGKRLADDRSMMDYGVSPNCTLHMVLRLRG